MNVSKDALVSARASWVCISSTKLHELLITTRADLEEKEPDSSAQYEPACLERPEEGSPCVITLLCGPDSGAVITSVQVVSEARTVEVYSLSGDYCGTSRGEEDRRWQQNGTEEKKCFYKTHLVLESPVESCEVKLLSLGGRSTVGIAQVAVGLRFLQTGRPQLLPSPGIDLERVRTMMQEMGATLSPGAQNLMEMVQFQQKNKSDMLGGFLPLLMGGGALACLGKGSTLTPPCAGSDGAQAPSGPNPVLTSDDPGLTEGVETGNRSPLGPEFLPVLQSVCGQVTRLRLDSLNSAEKKNGERDELVGCSGLEKAVEKVVEKRMEEIERRLKEHMDARLDALQQRLELTLQQILTHSSIQQ